MKDIENVERSSKACSESQQEGAEVKQRREYSQMSNSCSSRSLVALGFGWVWLFVSLTGGLVLADPPSQIFRTEGPGGSSYYSPDDEHSRLTASAQVVTPHLEWGRPWAAGPLRGLAITHKEVGRWPIELSQRFDFQVTTIYTHSSEKLVLCLSNICTVTGLWVARCKSSGRAGLLLDYSSP